MAAAAEAGFVAAGQVYHPFFLLVELGCEFALVVADVDLLDVFGCDYRSACVDRIGGYIGFDFVETTALAWSKRGILVC